MPKRKPLLLWLGRDCLVRDSTSTYCYSSNFLEYEPDVYTYAPALLPVFSPRGWRKVGPAPRKKKTVYSAGVYVYTSG